MPFFKRSGTNALRLCSVVFLVALTGLPAFADSTGTWSGNVTQITTTQITVNAKQTGTTTQKSRRFLIGDDFTGVWTSYGNKKKTLADVKTGMTVQVKYQTRAIEHVDHALKITIVNGFNLNIPLGVTPAPLATATPPGH